MDEKVFKEYFARLRKEAWLKASITGLIIAFSVLFVSSLVIWLTSFKFIWLAVILWAVTAVAATFALYYWKFTPSKKLIAQRMDALGLEERVLTMVEFEGKEDSYILRRQREDALAAIGNISAKLIKFAVPVAMIVVACVCACLGVGMTTVSALGASGVIKNGNEIIKELTTPEPTQYMITYEVEGGGFINGELFLIDTVNEGEDGIEVVAEEEDGWAFECWSDGVTDPIRKATEVKGDMELIAIFVEVPEGEPGEPGEGEEGDESDGVPKDMQEGEGDKGEPGEGPPQDGSQGSGMFEASNQIIDGETWYGGSTFDEAYDAAMGEVSGNGDISNDGQDIVGNYMNGIQQ